MLCSKCYKEIPEGKEINKVPNFWRPSKWGSQTQIICKRCAINQDIDELFVLTLISSIFFLSTLTILIYLLGKGEKVSSYINLLFPMVISFAAVVIFSIFLNKHIKKSSRLRQKKLDLKILEIRVNDLVNELQEIKSMKKTNDNLGDIFADIEKALRKIKRLKEEIEELKKADN